MTTEPGAQPPGDGETAVVERWIAAAPETIYPLLTSAEGWTSWQGTEAEIEAEPGGVFRVNVLGNGFVSGEFVELVKDRRVVFTWGWEGSTPMLPVGPGESRVELELTPQRGGTLLRITHIAPGVPEFRHMFEDGWAHYASRLGTLAEGGDPGLDPRVVGSGEWSGH